MTVARRCSPCGEPQTVYWGFSALTALTALDVALLDHQEERRDTLGTFSFPEGGANRYLWIAIPTAFGVVETFTTDGYLDWALNYSNVTISGVPYTLYRSTYQQNSAGIVLESD